MSSFEKTLNNLYPGALPQERFVEASSRALKRLGFDADNTIACVGVCRDEICRPLVDAMYEAWGEAFNFSSLAGMLFLGRTGFSAAQHHAPVHRGRQRYLYLVAAHIALGERGEIGLCHRTGQSKPSNACGALCAFLGELKRGSVHADLRADDIEQSLLKARLLEKIRWGQVPSLPELTLLAGKVIQEDLENMIALTVDASRADYAVLCGIQIHGPEGAELFWPTASYAVVSGKKRALKIGKGNRRKK
jgi:hypothetical protein